MGSNGAQGKLRQRRERDPEKLDDALDRSRPKRLTRKQKKTLKSQWHPAGMAHPLSTSYPGYRGPRRSVIKPENASLSMEIYPMYYTPVTRSSSFKLRFASNTFRTREVSFETFFNMTRLINFNYHPTKVKLILWNNVFWLNFSKPLLIDEFDVTRALEYGSVRISNTRQPMPTINARMQNSIFLDPQRRYSFRASQLRKIVATRGRVVCKQRVRRVRGYRMIRELRRRQRQQMFARMQREQAMAHSMSQIRQQPRRLRIQPEISDGVRIRKINVNKLATTDSFAKKNIRQEMSDGKRSMLLLYSRRHVREIIVVCKIK